MSSMILLQRRKILLEQEQPKGRRYQIVNPAWKRAAKKIIKLTSRPI